MNKLPMKYRDELFALRMKLSLLEKKKDNPLYSREIVELKQQMVELKKKIARHKTELYNEELCNGKSK